MILDVACISKIRGPKAYHQKSMSNTSSKPNITSVLYFNPQSFRPSPLTPTDNHKARTNPICLWHPRGDVSRVIRYTIHIERVRNRSLVFDGVNRVCCCDKYVFNFVLDIDSGVIQSCGLIYKK